MIQCYRRRNSNPRTQLMKIIRRAGLKPWPKLFQNLRSTRETELADPTDAITEKGSQHTLNAGWDKARDGCLEPCAHAGGTLFGLAGDANPLKIPLDHQPGSPLFPGPAFECLKQGIGRLADWKDPKTKSTHSAGLRGVIFFSTDLEVPDLNEKLRYCRGITTQYLRQEYFALLKFRENHNHVRLPPCCCRTEEWEMSRKFKKSIDTGDIRLVRSMLADNPAQVSALITWGLYSARWSGTPCLDLLRIDSKSRTVLRSQETFLGVESVGASRLSECRNNLSSGCVKGWGDSGERSGDGRHN